MPTPNERLAESLAELEPLQASGRRVFRSAELSRVHRERLLKTGFLKQVLRGWLVSSNPGTGDGDSTPWYASFWQFCALYCEARFSTHWHLAAEQSLFLHAERTVIPPQVIVHSSSGSNNTIDLLFGTSLYDLKEIQPPPPEDLVTRDGLRLYALEAALIRVPEAFFAQQPIESQVALSSVRDASGLLRRLLGGGNSVVAGRLAGAFRRAGRPEIADEICKAMSAAGYSVCEIDPFATTHVFANLIPATAPIVSRLRSMWDATRGKVLELFPPAPGLPSDRGAYMLASGGYPWAVIRVEDRSRYLSALDSASIDINIGPFATLLAERVTYSLSRFERSETKPQTTSRQARARGA